MITPLSFRVLLLGALLSAAGAACAQVPAKAAAKAQAKTPAKAPAKAPLQTGKPALMAPPTGGVKPEDRARELTTSMAEALHLAPDQIKRVQEINLLSVQRVEEARRTFARQLPRMRAEIDLIGESRLTLLKNVLTEQQFRAYTAMRERKMGIPEALKQQAAMSEAAGGQ